MLPNYASYEADEQDYILWFLSVFLLLYCDTGYQIICNTVCLTWHLCYVKYIAYIRPVVFFDLLFIFCSIVAFLFLQTFMGMIILHIAKINTDLHITNEENSKLLNNMHEGVLILAKSDNSIMLSNKPAQKLIKKFINKGNFLL